MTYKDIVLDDIQDNYYLLPLKILRILKWFKNTFPHSEFRPEFLMKMDHDVFLNLPNVVRHLKSKSIRNSRSDYIGGSVSIGSPVTRDETHKWYISYEEWKEETLPPYVLGAFYVFKGSTAVSVYEAGMKEDKIVLIEDVFITGIIAHRRLGIPLSQLGSDKSDVVLIPSSCQLLFFFNYFRWDPVRGIAFHPADNLVMRKFYGISNSG